MTQISLLSAARSLAVPFPAVLAQAQALAATLVLGEHGRRRAGPGDAFWQFRPAQTGDPMRSIDWRRSARADDQYVRETEWQSAQTVQFWVDPAASMDFGSGDVTKAARAQVLALALAILLSEGGERIGLANGAIAPQSGCAQIERLAGYLGDIAAQADFGEPDAGALVARSTAVFISDFFGDFAEIQTAVTQAADRGVTGVLVMVLDPQETQFPFQGRTIFESMAGSVRHETQRAGDLRVKYQAALDQRQGALHDLARHVGWQAHVHVTDQLAQSALLWLHQAIGGTR